MKNTIIRPHALDQFISRSIKLHGAAPMRPEALIRKMLLRAKQEAMNPAHRVKRLIRNGYKDATYLVCEGWRFVIVGSDLVTCERQKPEQN